MPDTVQMPRTDAVKLLYNLKNMKTLIGILFATDNQSVRKTIIEAMLRNVAECHDGIEFHCQIKD